MLSFAAAIPVASAQDVGVRHYTVAEGLAQNTVGVIYQDPAGFLWFGTAQGLSRFDGEEFRNYGRPDGLPHPIINGIAEDRFGRLWVAPFEAGMVRAREGASGPLFAGYRIGSSASNAVSSMTIDAAGRVWLVAYDGVYRMTAGAGEPVFDLVSAHTRQSHLSRIFIDSRGTIWFGRDAAIVRVKPDDVTAAEEFTPGPIGGEPVVAFTERRDGTIVAATASRIVRLLPGRSPADRDAWQLMTGKSPSRWTTIAADSNDRLWLGTADGLFRWDDQRQLAAPLHGLDGHISTIAEDRQRNVWIATYGLGLYKIPRDTIVSYTRAHGLPSLDVQGTVEGHDGRVYATFEGAGMVEVQSGGATAVAGSARPPFHTVGRRVITDARGDWWMATNAGIFHLPGPALIFARPVRPGGIDAAIEGTALYEHGDRDVWVGTSGSVVLKIDRATDAVARVPALSSVGRFAADRSGAMWMANYGSLARWRGDRLESMAPTVGLPETLVRSLFVDSRGWLWVGLRYHGVSVAKHPEADLPSFENYSTASGLAGEAVGSITEDGTGRIYLATGNGLDRLDPRTGAIRHFTTADGLASSSIHHLMRDRNGEIWISTTGGLSRLRPDVPDTTPYVPMVRLTRVQIGGDDVQVAWRGLSSVDRVTVPASRNNLLIEYVAPSFQGERTMHYQYRLDGADRDWSPPTRQRSVIYGRLAPGSYQFAVRAVSADAHAGPETATLAFQILPPFWQRWWFMATLVTIAVLVAGGFHRLRVRQILAMERVRRQVSLDLHDDVGSGLAQIAVLSDAASDAAVPAAQAWATVGTLARSLRESMSDIVWAVDPNKDRLADLVQRMKPVAFNLFEADGIRVAFVAPDDRTIARIALAPDRRRHLLLIFKEALTNISRHAGATEVRITIGVDPGILRLTIHDNGRGFDPARATEGQGRRSIERRARELDATLTIRSTLGAGATLDVAVPLT